MQISSDTRRKYMIFQQKTTAINKKSTTNTIPTKDTSPRKNQSNAPLARLEYTPAPRKNQSNAGGAATVMPQAECGGAQPQTERGLASSN
jgi:hypothetical protein